MKKKIILLFTMICAGQLYGMEPQQPSYELLPELKREIIKKALPASYTMDEAISALKGASTFYGLQFDKLFFDNLKDFTALMNVLAKKFPDMSREEIAQKFNTPLAKKYLTLGHDLTDEVFDIHLNADKLLAITQKLLTEGLDPNFSWKKVNRQWHFTNTSYLEEVCDKIIDNIGYGDFVPLVQLLLEKGAISNKFVIAMLENNIAVRLARAQQFPTLSYPESAIEALELLKQYADK